MNVAGYVRVSTDKQADKGYSISEQTERITSYCAAKGWNLVKVYTDPGFSGGDINRPALQLLVESVEMYDVILVNKLDRLSRSQKDTLHLIQDVFAPAGCSFVSMQESFDTTTPIGIAMVGILSAFAQLERSQIKERMRMGIEGRRKKGRWHGSGHPPTGYDYIDGQLVVNDEADQVRLIYQMFLEGMGQRAITNYMRAHYTTQYQSWPSAGTVTGILKNPIYIGMVGDVPGLHEPIIDRETFGKVQAIFQGRKVGKKTVTGRHLLTGMIWCGCCGGRVGIMSSVRTNAQGQTVRYGYYRCSRTSSTNVETAAHLCGLKWFKEADIDAAVIAQILSLRYEPIEPPKPVIVDHSQEIEKINRQIARLIDLYSAVGSGLEEVSARLSDLKRKKDLLIEEQNAAPPPASSATDALAIARDVFERGPIEQKRAIVDALIDRVVIHNDHIEIHWKFC